MEGASEVKELEQIAVRAKVRSKARCFLPTLQSSRSFICARPPYHFLFFLSYKELGPFLMAIFIQPCSVRRGFTSHLRNCSDATISEDKVSNRYFVRARITSKIHLLCVGARCFSPPVLQLFIFSRRQISQTFKPLTRLNPSHL